MMSALVAEPAPATALRALPRAESSVRQILSALVSSVLAVCMAIFGMTSLALIVLGAWWAFSHAAGLAPLAFHAAASLTKA